MLLTFSKDMFVDQIKNGTKIHTIREDRKRRWRKGMKIHFWRGNPRNPSKHPYRFGESTCTGVQEILILRREISPNQLEVEIRGNYNGRELSPPEILQLAQNDGLTIDQFRMWFVPPDNPFFRGRIIHWTPWIY